MHIDDYKRIAQCVHGMKQKLARIPFVPVDSHDQDSKVAVGAVWRRVTIDDPESFLKHDSRFLTRLTTHIQRIRAFGAVPTQIEIAVDYLDCGAEPLSSLCGVPVSYRIGKKNVITVQVPVEFVDEWAASEEADQEITECHRVSVSLIGMVQRVKILCTDHTQETPLLPEALKVLAEMDEKIMFLNKTLLHIKAKQEESEQNAQSE